MGPQRWAEFAPTFDLRKGGDGLVTVEAWKEEHTRALKRSRDVFLPVLRTLEAERCSSMRQRGASDVKERSEEELAEALSAYCGDEAEFFTKMRVTQQDANGLGFYGVQEAADKYTEAKHQLEQFEKNNPKVEGEELEKDQAELVKKEADARTGSIPYTGWSDSDTPARWRPPVPVDHGAKTSGDEQAPSYVHAFLPVLEQFVKENSAAIEEQLKARGAKVALPKTEALTKLLVDNSGSEAALFTFLRVHLFGTGHVALQCAAQSAEEASSTLVLEACKDWLGSGASSTSAEAKEEVAEGGDSSAQPVPEVDAGAGNDAHKDTSDQSAKSVPGSDEGAGADSGEEAKEEVAEGGDASVQPVPDTDTGAGGDTSKAASDQSA